MQTITIDLAQFQQMHERIAELEMALRELVSAFNPEPKTPPLTMWDRAAAVLNRTAQ